MRGRQPWAPLQKSQMTPESSVLFVLQENSASRIMSNKTFILRKIHTIGSFCCSRPPFHQWHNLILLLTSGMRSKITSDKCFARQIATHNQFQFVNRRQNVPASALSCKLRSQWCVTRYLNYWRVLPRYCITFHVAVGIIAMRNSCDLELVQLPN